MNAVIDIKKGLEGVVVDNTATSLVDGEAGRLYYRGYPYRSAGETSLRGGGTPAGVRRVARGTGTY